MRTTITFEQEHLALISRALEAYARAGMGQFGIMTELIFPDKLIDWDDRDKIEKLMREVIFDEPKMGSLSYSYGIANGEVGDGQMAYEIHKVVNQFLAVQRSGGKWGYTTDYQDAMKYSGVALPEIHGFKKYIDYPIDDTNYEFTKLYQAGDGKACWGYIEKNVEFLKGDKSEIVTKKAAEMGDVMAVDYFLRVWKPKLDKGEF